MAKRKPPVPKHKNSPGMSHAAPKRNRRFSTSSTTSMSTTTTGSFPGSPSRTPPRLRPPKWVPMAHGCAECATKTTAPDFKRSCLGNHEVACKRFHKTLLRPGKESACAACVMEDEMAARREKEIADKRAILHDIRGKTRDVVKRRTALEAEIAELVLQDQAVRDNTERQYLEREWGYSVWKSQ